MNPTKDRRHERHSQREAEESDQLLASDVTSIWGLFIRSLLIEQITMKQGVDQRVFVEWSRTFPELFKGILIGVLALVLGAEFAPVSKRMTFSAKCDSVVDVKT